MFGWQMAVVIPPFLFHFHFNYWLLVCGYPWCQAGEADISHLQK